MNKIDLHLHSSYSDGELTVANLAERIKEANLSYCALTDHDTVDGVLALDNCLKNTKTKNIPAVELTVLYGEREIHILAYGFEVEQMSSLLWERIQIVNQKKVFELEESIKLFRRNGFVISNAVTVNPKQPVGLTIALDVYNNPDNADKVAGLTPEQFYKAYQAPGRPCYVERSGVSLDWVISKIRGCCQNLILAHPFNSVSLFVKPLSLDEIKEIILLGLDGVEVYHPGIDDQQVKLLKNFVFNNNLMWTGGSDFHNPKKQLFPLGYYAIDRKIDLFKLYGYTERNKKI